MNTLFVGTVSNFNKPGMTTDKNGNQNLFISPLAGKMPNRVMVFNGTLAVRANVQAGDTCLFSATEGDVDPKYGRQFSLAVVSHMGALEIMDSVAKLGEALIVDVSKTEPKVIDEATVVAEEVAEEVKA